MLAALLTGTAASAEPVISTAPARAARATRAPQNPWALSYGLDRRGDRYGRVDYRLRWSFRDLDFSGGSREQPSRPGAPFEETVRGLMQGMLVEVYGVRMRPFRDLALSAPLPAVHFSASTATVSGAGVPHAPVRRFRLYSWERFYDDLESSARRETERFIVRESFDRVLSEHRATPYDEKKAFGSGLLGLGRGVLTDEPFSRPPP
jgi:hypothetical protein